MLWFQPFSVWLFPIAGRMYCLTHTIFLDICHLKTYHRLNPWTNSFIYGVSHAQRTSLEIARHLNINAILQTCRYVSEYKRYVICSVHYNWFVTLHRYYSRSVSYTHLDVYKRQGKALSGEAGNLSGPPEERAGQSSILPVCDSGEAFLQHRGLHWLWPLCRALPPE